MTTRKDIEQVLWNACDSFRGKIDSSRYKDYILSMLFVKYLSDVSKEFRRVGRLFLRYRRIKGKSLLFCIPQSRRLFMLPGDQPSRSY